MPTIGLLSCDAAGRAVELGVPKAEDAAVGADHPVPPAAGVGAMPTTEALALGRAFWPSGASPNGTTDWPVVSCGHPGEPAEAPDTAG